ncbi:MAG: TIGR00269 family protein [Ignisphaera sp.]
MILPEDTVLIGISGGKDSYVLLRILAEIHSTSKIVGLMIEEGIRGYNRADVFSFLKKICNEIGVDCLITSIRKELGYSVDDFNSLQLERYDKPKISACTYCGIARRRILNAYARMLGADKVATGHNLDDEVQTYLINILRGDIMRLVQLHPLSVTHSKLLVKRVKPLRTIYEYETSFLAYIENFRFQEVECPYILQRPTLRSRVREMVKELERSYPDIQIRFLRYIDSVLEPLVKSSNEKAVNLPLCSQCGEPTSPSRNICKFCELINSIVSNK